MARSSIDVSPERGPEHKRRKVRKGTQSCWECKRRKIRCTFAAPSNRVCDGCRRRGSSCVSQEFPDEPSTAKQVEDRLGRVEELLERLTPKDIDSGGLPATPPIDLSQKIHTNFNSLPKEKPREPGTPNTTIAAESSLRGNLSHSDLSRRLVAAWPSQKDLDAMLDLPDNVSELLGSAAYTLYSDALGLDAPSSRDILQVPLLDSHPVLIARKSLLLALYIQGVQKVSPLSNISFSDASCDSTMSRLVETIHNLVTCNDDLAGCLEGIECLVIESLYHNNGGNLRRAWLAARRAMLLAQLMGLHRGVELASVPKITQSDARIRIDPSSMWFRLIQIDRYLSLMLGFPLWHLEDTFADQKALESCMPLERMQRLQCVASGRIIRHIQAGIDDLASAHEIDTLLHEASALMPPKWWLPLDAGAATETSRETVRIMNVLPHHYLLLRLHLPYLLRSSADSKYDYSKITAVNASREIVSLFVSVRAHRSTTAYCRGTDFLAFIASTTLCIAHLEAQRYRQMSNTDQTETGCHTVFRFLGHQRLADRGMMERALAIMQTMSRDGKDKIASKISSILGHLLDIEADAAAGGTYNTDSARGNSTGGKDEAGCDGSISDGGSVLRIYIPYFGTIRIARSGVSKTGLEVMEKSGHNDLGQLPADWQETCQPTPTPFSKSSTDHQMDNAQATPGWQSASSHFPSMAMSELPPTSTQTDTSFDPLGVGYTLDEGIFAPGLAAVVDDWALQGVDMAFFDSLLQGTTSDDHKEG